MFIRRVASVINRTAATTRVIPVATTAVRPCLAAVPTAVRCMSVATPTPATATPITNTATPSPAPSSSQTNTSSQSSADTTHFGYRTVATAEKEHLVADVFHRVASNYDIMNDVMTAGIHRLWKDQFIDMLHPLPGMKLLDVAGGTGDIAFRFLDVADSRAPPPALSSPIKTGETSVVVCDINPSMLQVGRDRARARNLMPPAPAGATPDTEAAGARIRFVQGDAQKLPFADNTFDAYTIAFGLRNVTNVQQALIDAHRVLKKGGRFMCLEFSQVDNPLLRQLYDLYSFNVIPVMGEVVSKDRASYQYLVESIRQFPPQEQLCSMMRTAGFGHVSYTNFTFGVCAVHSGFKL